MRKLSAVVLSMALVFNSMSMVSAGTEQDANDAYETSTNVENPWAELMGSGEDGTIEVVTEDNEQVLENPWGDLFEDETTTEEVTEEPTTEKPTTETPTEEPTTEAPTQSQKFEIVAQPEDVITSAGSTVKFTVQATGNNLKYQWQLSLDGGESWVNSTSNGATSKTISFTATDAFHGRKYQCVVTSGNETLTSDVATVYIDTHMDELMITSQPQNKTVAKDSRTFISVGATGNEVKYQWQVSTDGGNTWINSTADGYNTPAVRFNASESFHGRMYRCVVTDKNGNSVESEAAVVLIDTLVNELRVITQPQQKVVSAGERAFMSVGATGQGLKYQWQVSTDGGNTWINSTADGYNTSAVRFNATEAFHGRMYRCVVTDKNGDSVESEAAPVLIDTLVNELRVITQPQQKIVSVGERAFMSVGATGQGLKYQWQVSLDGGVSWTNSTADGYNTSAVRFNASEAFHGRMYRCVVSDKNGDSVESEGAVVLIDTLADQLMITTQPQDQTVATGERTFMSVGATGQGLKYQWQVSVDFGKTWINSTADGYNTSGVRFTPSNAFDTRYYRCVVSDKNGNSIASEAAVVLIKSLLNELKIVKNPKDAEVAAGSTVKMSIQATGNNITYQWQVSVDGGKTWVNSSSDGSKSANVSFKATSAFNGRLYRCVVTDASGATVESAPATVTVK